MTNNQIKLGAAQKATISDQELILNINIANLLSYIPPQVVVVEKAVSTNETNILLRENMKKFRSWKQTQQTRLTFAMTSLLKVKVMLAQPLSG